MPGRILAAVVFVAAAARALLDAPPDVAYGATVAILVWWALRAAVKWWRMRELLRQPQYQPGYGAEHAWEDCDATHIDHLGQHWGCHKRKGHEAPHEGVTPVVHWP